MQHTKAENNLKKGPCIMPKIQKLPSGTYRIQVSKKVDGILYRESFTGTDPDKIALAAAEWKVNVENENKIDNITLKQAFEKYIDIKSSVLSPSTIRAYKSMSKNVFQNIMSLKVKNLTALIIQKEINLLSATATPKYVRNAYGLLTAVLSVFRPSFNPNISMPKKKKTEMYIPDDEDIKVLLNAVKGKEIEIPILLAAFGPMRRGEICALTSEDVHGNIVTVNKALVMGDDKKWHLKEPKTYSSYRNIEYPDFVIKRLEGIEGKLTTMTPSAITDAFQKILKKCGLPSFRFHDLRHYAVSTLHAINVPDKYIMARGGWATNYTMNNVYNHTLKSKTDETENQISKHFTDVYSD